MGRNPVKDNHYHPVKLAHSSIGKQYNYYSRVVIILFVVIASKTLLESVNIITSVSPRPLMYVTNNMRPKPL